MKEFNGKYIISKIGNKEVAILFSPHIIHNNIGTNRESRGQIVSAGFFTIKDNVVSVYGKSETLKLESREEDSEIIEQSFS